MESAFHSRLAHVLAGEVNAEQRIGIQMMKGKVEIGRKGSFQPDTPGDRQVSLLEFGVGIEIKLTSMRDGVEVEITCALPIESKVLEMNVGIDRRLRGSAACSQGEVGDAIRREAAGLQAREMGDVQVTSRDI